MNTRVEMITLTSESASPNSNWAKVGLSGWGSHTCQVAIEVIDGEPRMIGLRIEPRTVSPPDGPTIGDRIITRNRLAGFPVQGVAQAIGTYLLGGEVDVLEALRAIAETPMEPASPRQMATAAKVAAIYKAAREAGLAPRKAVVEQLNMSNRTADRYIGQARAEGLLPPYDAEKKGRAK